MTTYLQANVLPESARTEGVAVVNGAANFSGESQLQLGNMAGSGETLHPKSCTLHTAPYTLHPTPYTLHPTPYTLHPAPNTPYPTPYTMHPAPSPQLHLQALNP